MAILDRFLRGQGVSMRAVKSSATLALSFGATNVLRLGSNLILTRLLFPEAFGLMALVSVFLFGLQMISDTGISPSIMQHRRGDEQDFLDTAWTLQILRGVILWMATIALAYPVAWLYQEPILAQLLPVAGLSLLISGFNPTRGDTEFRHLRAFRVTVLEFTAQAIGIFCTLLLAWWLASVWGLVIGMILGALIKVLLMDLFLAGPRNRFHINRQDAIEILQFGKWIFVSSIAGFLVLQGDKAVLGAYLTLAALGIYNIGYFLGSFPAQLADAVMSRVIIPLYRESPPWENEHNARNVRRLRFLLSGGTLALLGLFAFGGIALVDLLYDERYQAAGPVVVLIAFSMMLGLASKTYDQAALAAGDSRGFSAIVTTRAVLQTAFLWIGAHWFGIVGAVIGQGLALLLVHAASVMLARRHKVWDPLHDLIIIGGAFALGAGAIYLHIDAVTNLLAMSKSAGSIMLERTAA